MEILAIELLCEVTTPPLSLKTVHRLMDRLGGEKHLLSAHVYSKLEAAIKQREASLTVVRTNT